MVMPGSDCLDIAVIGNVGIDTNVYFGDGILDLTRESNFTQNLDCVGQAGGYCARGFARLGRRAAFIGYVGDDLHGRYIREVFAAEGIDTDALFVDPQGTCRSINLMYGDGRRRNFYDGKGHMTLQPDLEVCRRVLSRCRAAHIHLPNWGRALLPEAKQLGLTLSCDLQDVVSADDPYRRDFVAAADILFFSAVNHADPTPIVHSLLGVRPDAIVVVGMGPAGCLLATTSGLRRFPPLELGGPVLDANGAGDALSVGFLTSYVLDGRGLEESVLRGQIAARFSCAARKAGAPRLIGADEMESWAGKLGDADASA